jgi:hypothetical protein
VEEREEREGGEGPNLIKVFEIEEGGTEWKERSSSEWSTTRPLGLDIIPKKLEAKGKIFSPHAPLCSLSFTLPSSLSLYPPPSSPFTPSLSPLTSFSPPPSSLFSTHPISPYISKQETKKETFT